MALGPRGVLGLHLVHQYMKNSDGPTHIEWQSPSAPLVALLSELLAGQKLADAEVIVASLDLVMAEADG
jgi:NADH:ubiquinone oxidoreductase subunit D